MKHNVIVYQHQIGKPCGSAIFDDDGPGSVELTDPSAGGGNWFSDDNLRAALTPAFGSDPAIEALTLPELERLALVYAKQLRERSAPTYAKN